MKLYSELAEYYYHIEKSGRNLKQELRCLDELFRSHKVKTIIDLGCGTGEHVEALRRLGYDMLGVDNSNFMLNVAKKRFPYARFQLGSMQDFRVDTNYDALVCLYGTFNYLTNFQDIQNTFHSIYSALKPKGLLILEIWNSIPIQKIRKKPISPVNVCSVGSTIVKRNRGFRISNEDNNLVEVNFSFDVNSKIINDHHVMRVFTKEEIETYLNQFKFEIHNVYKDFQRKKFNNKSIRMLFICQKQK